MPDRVPPAREPDPGEPHRPTPRVRRRSLSRRLRAIRRGPGEWTAVEPEPQGQPRRRVVVCGDDPLAHRLVDEMAGRYPVDITVIMPSKRRNHGPRIAAIEGVRVVESDRLDTQTLRAAGVARADALALVHQDDVGNIHAALRAQDLNPDIRLVIRMFNMSLGSGIRAMFADCAVLSDASMAAPSFVAAALGEVTPTHIRLPGRTLYVARRRDVPPDKVLCGLADTSRPGEPVLLPTRQEDATLVLAVADGQSRAATRSGLHRGPVRRLGTRLARGPYIVSAFIRALFVRRLWRAVLVLSVLLLAASALLTVKGEMSLFQAAYQTLSTALGGGNAIDTHNTTQVIAQMIVLVAGVALIPVITAAVIETMVNTPWASLTALGFARHVIVVGLGNVGTRVIQQLHDLGYQVVAIDKKPDARGTEAARQREIPVIIGDAGREETLRAANVQHCRALLALSTDDVINLEAALHARGLNPGVQVVLRLFDGDFAELVQRSYGLMASRSVSYVAAPAFAAALLDREVIGSIPVERRVLLVAQIPVGPGSTLDGRTVADAHEANEVRVIAVTPGSPQGDGERPGWMVWSPPGHRRVRAGDSLLVIASRAGLGQVLGQASQRLTEPGRA